VLIRDETGVEIARGLIRYEGDHARRIVGMKSAAIEPELGYTSGPMVHADDLALAASSQSA
jgi:glutamate 5-kinase